jgi:hypothetical protein
MEFTTEDIAREIGLSKQTVRNWITEGIVAIPNRPGTGKALLLTGLDAIQLLVAAELSHLGVGPKIFRLFVAQIAYHVWEQINALYMISEVQAKGQQAARIEPRKVIPIEEYIEAGRYYILYYDNSEESTFSITQVDCPTNDIDSVDVSRIMIDTLNLAQKAMSIFSKIG